MKKKLKFTKNIFNENQESEKKKKILASAIKIIGDKGYQNATIAEIAKDAGIGDATIYEYFKNKEDLLLSIPVEVTKELIPQINDHMMGIKGALNKLRKFIWWWLNYVEKNPGYGSIVLLELKTSKTYVSNEAYQAARNFYKIVLDIIKEGQEEGSVKKEINIFLARSICVGAIEHIIIRWLLKDRRYSLTQYADELADLLIDSFKKEESTTSKEP
ncbi:MAG: TetR/AcrR family transcriptional regulator [Syntrophaceae bacterium]|nr:TetR/AcrR family transcriptional regulator [Syntrophaceae bacterium]